MLNIQTPIINYQLVTIPVNQTQTRYYFPDLPNLRDVKTYKISAFHLGLISKDINGVGLVPQADFNASYITLYSGGFEFVQKIGLSVFNNIALQTNAVNENGTLGLTPVEIDFSKSFVEVAPSITVTPPFSFMFGVYYAK
jgi:hypothetical protein